MGLFGSDVHHYHTETKTVPYEKTVTVHEHKAPTDESIKIYREMEEKAKLNIVHSVRLDENTIKAIAVCSVIGGMEDTVEYIMKFSLNGTEYLIREKIDRYQFEQENREAYMRLGNKAIYEVLHKRFAEAIALELMKQSPDFTKSLITNGK